MQIKIITGAYGLYTHGTVELKTAESGIFEIDDTEGERLVALKVAEAVATGGNKGADVKTTNHKPEKKPAKNGNSAKKRVSPKEDKVVLTAELPE